MTLARFHEEINEVTRRSSEPERSLATALRKVPDPFQFENHDPEWPLPTWPQLRPETEAAPAGEGLPSTPGSCRQGGRTWESGLQRAFDIAPDAAAFPRITALLLDHGYSEEEVKKILGGNFLRLFRKVTGS